MVEGRLAVLGRLDDRITTGGEKVYPQEVEHVLRAHSAVRDALVRGEPDLEWGARVVALVELRDPGVSADAHELREYVRARLAAHKVPADVLVVDTLPRTLSGTLARPAMRPPAR
jgi:O-succinylbenzoic acid--CoA ligase